MKNYIFFILIIFTSSSFAQKKNKLDFLDITKKTEIKRISKKLNFKEFIEYHDKNRTFITSSERLTLSHNFKSFNLTKGSVKKENETIAVIEMGFSCNNKEIVKFIVNNCKIKFNRSNYKESKKEIENSYKAHSFYVISIISLINEKIKIYPIEVDNHPDSTALAIHHAIDKGIKLINISMNGYVTSPNERRAFERAFENDVKIVISAGNENINTEHSTPFPSGYTKDFPNVISVGSFSKNMNEKFSNVGSLVDVYTIGRFKTLNQEIKGTSFSAPVISSLISLGVDYKKSLKNIEEVVFKKDKKELIISNSKKLFSFEKENLFKQRRISNLK